MSEENRHRELDLLLEELVFRASIEHVTSKSGKIVRVDFHYDKAREVLGRYLDEAERRGAEKMRERAAKFLKRGHDSECRCLPCGEVEPIRALPLEGPKDGRE